jgi:hypothetical protein
MPAQTVEWEHVTAYPKGFFLRLIKKLQQSQNKDRLQKADKAVLQVSTIDVTPLNSASEIG